MTEFFEGVEQVRYEGPDTDNPFAFRYYDADRLVMGKSMKDHLRMAVAYWHSFNWPGNDVFGAGTFDRPWLDPSMDPMVAARMKMDAAFEFFSKLGFPFWCFHDADISPAGATFAETRANLEAMVDYAETKMAETGVGLLWGTSNMFSHPRFAAGAATNPDPGAFAYGAAQVKNAIDATQRLGGTAYVLWGGREGYETVLNTRMKQEADQFARFLHMVVDYKKSIGFEGQLFIEPKPQEPTKHQYDYDSSTVHGFLERYDLMGEVFVNIEVNHATLAGHSFHHEVAYAIDNGVFGSVDANRGDPQNGWDTDQFPNSVEEVSLALYEILRAGGFKGGGFNFDSKLRRQSMARDDLFHAHIGGADTLALSLLVATQLIEDGTLEAARDERYAAWNGELGSEILGGGTDLASLEARVASGEIDPTPVSGRQEALENLVNRTIWKTV
ncbi:MAG: xylose isomerase [Actinomycetota bacterium]